MEEGFDTVTDLSCVNPSGKKMVLIRYPKDMNIKLIEKMNLNLNAKGDVLGEVTMDSSESCVKERFVAKRDNTVNKSIRPLVCSKKSKKSSKSGIVATVGADGLSVGGVFDGSITILRQSEYVTKDPTFNTSTNIRPSYEPVAQLEGLKVVSLPFGSTSTLESVNSHHVQSASKTPSKAAASFSSGDAEKSSKKKLKREKEAEEAVGETPSKKKSKKDKK